MSAADYEYDGTGNNPANLIENEFHAVNSYINRSIIPDHHPFFGDSLVIEGRPTAGLWRPLYEGIDFFFSPMYIEGSARASGQQVFTYIVLIDEKINETRWNYQALGKYEDTRLLTQLATASFDRTSTYEWSLVMGGVRDWAPMVRDPEVAEKNVLEVLNAQLERIRVAMSNPYTQDNNLHLEVTRLQKKIAAIPSLEEIMDQVLGKTMTVSVEAEVITPIHLIDADKDMLRGVVYYMSNDGQHAESFDLMIMSPEDEPIVVPHGWITTELISSTEVIATKVGAGCQIAVTAPWAGVFKLKIFCEY